MCFFYVKKEIKNINIVTVYLQSINILPLLAIFIFFFFTINNNFRALVELVSTLVIFRMVCKKGIMPDKQLRFFTICLINSHDA